jgi:hypothetical protein
MEAWRYEIYLRSAHSWDIELGHSKINFISPRVHVLFFISIINPDIFSQPSLSIQVYICLACQTLHNRWHIDKKEFSICTSVQVFQGDENGGENSVQHSAVFNICWLNIYFMSQPNCKRCCTLHYNLRANRFLVGILDNNGLRHSEAFSWRHF